MERNDALVRLKTLEGKDLYSCAEHYGVTVWKKSTTGAMTLNKGWFGHVIEHFLGLPQNSAQSPNFGSWELKTTSLKRKKCGTIVPKETLAITMIDPFEVLHKEFEDSHLFSKLKKMILVSRIVSEKYEKSGLVFSVDTFDLDDVELLRGIRNDYDLVRSVLKANNGRLESLSGKMGYWVQPRTKGSGHGSISRAFYGRKRLIQKIIGKIGYGKIL